MNNNFTKVSCPKCGAREGLLCRTATGHAVGSAYPHIDRVRAFAAKQRAFSLVNRPQDLRQQSRRSAVELIGRAAVRSL